MRNRRGEMFTIRTKAHSVSPGFLDVLSYPHLSFPLQGEGFFSNDEIIYRAIGDHLESNLDHSDDH